MTPRNQTNLCAVSINSIAGNEKSKDVTNTNGNADTYGNVRQN